MVNKDSNKLVINASESLNACDITFAGITTLGQGLVTCSVTEDAKETGTVSMGWKNVPITARA